MSRGQTGVSLGEAWIDIEEARGKVPVSKFIKLIMIEAIKDPELVKKALRRDV